MSDEKKRKDDEQKKSAKDMRAPWGWFDPFTGFFPRGFMDGWMQRMRDWGDDSRSNYPDPFSGLFGDIDRELMRMRREMDELMRMAENGELPSVEEGGPIVYGWSMHMGPDGRPEIQEFGNTRMARKDIDALWKRMGSNGISPPPPESNEAQEREHMLFREPITEVMERNDGKLAIIAEIPGVEKDQINLNITDSEVIIHVETGTRKYHKRISLPVPVKPNTARASYKNGVLEIQISKASPEESSGFKVKVE